MPWSSGFSSGFGPQASILGKGFPTSNKDPALMAILGIANTETLLYDFSETENFYVLVVPPEATIKTLFSVTIAYARQWFGLNTVNNLQIIFNPFLTSYYPGGSSPTPLTGATVLVDETTGAILTSDDGSFVLTPE